MKEFNQNLPWMYFKGIENGDITVLFFEKEELIGAQHGDLITFVGFSEKIKMYFDYSKIISFREVTDEIAKKAGFANKELLSEHLMNRFNITSYDFTVNSKIDDELFYMIVITDDPSKEVSDGEVSLKLNTIPGSMGRYCCNNKKYFYKYNKPEYYNIYKNCTLNDEYEQKPWRN